MHSTPANRLLRKGYFSRGDGRYSYDLKVTVMTITTVTIIIVITNNIICTAMHHDGGYLEWRQLAVFDLPVEWSAARWSWSLRSSSRRWWWWWWLRRRQRGWRWRARRWWRPQRWRPRWWGLRWWPPCPRPSRTTRRQRSRLRPRAARTWCPPRLPPWTRRIPAWPRPVLPWTVPRPRRPSTAGTWGAWSISAGRPSRRLHWRRRHRLRPLRLRRRLPLRRPAALAGRSRGIGIAWFVGSFGRLSRKTGDTPNTRTLKMNSCFYFWSFFFCREEFLHNIFSLTYL